MKIENKIILITGGTSGIGWALGKAFLEKHNTVILLGRNQQKLSEAEQKGFKTITCDLSRVDDIEKAVMTIQNEYGNLDVLINNAGIQNNYEFASNVIPLDKIHREIEVNVTSQVMLTQLLLPHLMTSESPLIVNTTSGLGAFPKPNGLVYSLSKAAMRNFTLGLRYSLRPMGVKVVEMIPPVTDTGMTLGRNSRKMPVNDLIRIVLPQIEKGNRIAAPTKIKIFLWVSFFFPGLANKILSKQ